MLLQVLWVFPESPRFNYSKDRFEAAKANLEVVAHVNGIKNYNSQNFMFDTEKEKMDMMHMDEGEIAKPKRDGGNLYGITTGKFVVNLIIFSLLFTCFSFSFWLADFQVEYLGTNIFVLFYANGCVFIISRQLVLMFYSTYGLRTIIFFTQSIAIAAGVYIIMV